jgi:hypothetical protein
MRSTPRQGLISLLVLTSTALLASGCVTAPVTLTPQSACSSLVGPSLRADVAGVELPGLTATAGDLWIAFDGQTGRLDTSNTYRRAALEIVQACEARDAAAARRITAPWWQFWRR